MGFRWGLFPVRTQGHSITSRRRAASVGSVDVEVPLTGGRSGILVSFGGAVILFASRRVRFVVIVAGVVFGEAVVLAAGGRRILFGSRAIVFRPEGLPVKGDPVSLTVGALRLDGVLIDWDWSVGSDAVGLWHGDLLDWVYALQAVVRPGLGGYSVVAALGARGDVAAAIAGIVGLELEGAAALDGDVEAEPKTGERWLAVWRRVIGSVVWRVVGRRLILGETGRYVSGRWQKISVEPTDEGRRTTVGVHDGQVVAVIGSGLPEFVVEAETEAEVQAAHDAAPLDALRVRSKAERDIDLQAGDLIVMYPPGLGRGVLGVVQESTVKVGPSLVPEVSAFVVSRGTVEDKVYG